MLVLTRKLDESIIIGNDIVVKVVSIAGNQVHIGISAPREVPIYRQEVYEQVRLGNRAAVAAAPPADGGSNPLVDLLRRAGSKPAVVDATA